MLLKLGNWTIDTELLKFSMGDKEFIVEPRAMDLLVFLTQNIGVVVSRDLLVENVWKGTVVSDHAVTACIAKLRKIFNTDQEIKSYIETVSKRGYRLNSELHLSILETQQPVTNIAANLQEKEKLVPLANYNEKESVSAGSKKLNKNHVILGFALLFFVTTVVINFIYLNPTKRTKPVNTVQYKGISPVTSLKGAERTPIWSPNGKFLSFLHGNPSTKEWSLKIVDEKNFNILHTIENTEKYMKPAWSRDSNSLVYAKNNDGQCDIMVASGFNKPLATHRKVARCQANASDTQFAWGNEQSLIYFTEKNSDYEPRAIYQLNINTGQKSKLTNPLEDGYGDYLLTYHSESNAIYFLRNKHWQKESFIYKFDISKKVLTEIYKENYLIQSLFVDEFQKIIYNQSDFNLVILDPETQQKEVLFQSAFPILDPFIEPNNQHLYLVAESINGTQLKTINTGGEPINIEAMSSSRDENNPQFAPNRSLLAYISNKTGDKEVYISNFSGNTIAKTQLRSEVIPYNIVWAQNSKSIYFTDKSVVYNFNIKTNELNSFEIPMKNVIVTSVSNDEQTFYFQSDQNVDWQIYRYHDGNIDTVTQTGGYHSQLSADNSKLYFNKFRRNGLWEIDLTTNIEKEIIQDIVLLFPQSFTVFDDAIYFKSETENGYQIKKYSLESKSIELFAEVNGAIDLGFSISYSRDNLVFAEHAISESDIVVTKNSLLKITAPQS